MSDQERFYDELWKKELAGERWQPGRYRRLVQRFEVHRFAIVDELLRAHCLGGQALLDAGCGTGELLALAGPRFREAVGLDISPQALAVARDRVGANVMLRQHSLDELLPFPPETFDLTLCVGVLEHIFDPYRATAELVRVTKPGGHLLVGVPNVAYLKHRLRLAAGRLPITSMTSSPAAGWDGGHLHYFTRSTLEELLRRAGLELVAVSSSGAFAHARNWWPSLLCGDLIAVARRT